MGKLTSYVRLSSLTRLLYVRLSSLTRLLYVRLSSLTRLPRFNDHVEIMSGWRA
jgi:hypothetical protein